MSATIVVLLIFALVGLLIAANAIEQYKQKQEFERHQRLTQLAAILHEDDDLLVNAVQMPMSNTVIATLLKRNIDVMEQIIELMPESDKMPPRLQETREQLESIDTKIKGRPELVIPGNDEHSAALIKSIKKLRFILHRQKKKGNISAKDFQDEDNALSFFLLKIFVEYKINQGIAAVTDQKLGSARQFFEKALKTLSSQSEFPEYVALKTKEVYERLEMIANRLKESNLEAIEIEEEKDVLEDLELVFNPTKKKW